MFEDTEQGEEAGEKFTKMKNRAKKTVRVFGTIFYIFLAFWAGCSFVIQTAVVRLMVVWLQLY